jgi:hypothetical protein
VSAPRYAIDLDTARAVLREAAVTWAQITLDRDDAPHEDPAEWDACAAAAFVLDSAEALDERTGYPAALAALGRLSVADRWAEYAAMGEVARASFAEFLESLAAPESFYA